MRGKVLGYDHVTGQGMISGDDGSRYAVSSSDLGSGTRSLIPGSNVDFEIQNGRAYAVFPILNAGSVGDKNKWVAAALAFFLGAFGVHKFYLGKKKAGIIMLVVFLGGLILLGIPSLVIAIIAFIEFIIYLVKDEQTFHEQYVAGTRSWF